MEDSLGCKVPLKIKQTLDEYGYNNHISMSKMTKEDIEEMKETGKQMKPPLLLASGHIHLIEGLIQVSKKIMDRPTVFRKSTGHGQLQKKDLVENGSNNTGKANRKE